MKIICDSCSTKYSIADEKVRGKVFKIKCKKCSHIIVANGDRAVAARRTIQNCRKLNIALSTLKD